MNPLSRHTRLALVACGMLAMTLHGCGGGSSAPAGPVIPSGGAAELAALIQSSIAPGTALPLSADTTASLLITVQSGSVRSATALFLSSGVVKTLADAGDVSVENSPPFAGVHPLDEVKLSVQNFVQTVFTTLRHLPSGVPLTFNGTTRHLFRVTGGGGFPAFVDSVTSVSAPTISTPGAGATVPRSDSLRVAWSDPGSDTTVYMVVEIDSQADTTKFAFGRIAADPAGELFVPAAAMGQLPAGGATLRLARYRLVYHAAAGRPKIGVACESVVSRDVTLQ